MSKDIPVALAISSAVDIESSLNVLSAPFSTNFFAIIVYPVIIKINYFQ